MLMAAGLPVAAHHSFSAEFDSTKAVKLEGTVVKLEWGESAFLAGYRRDQSRRHGGTLAN